MNIKRAISKKLSALVLNGPAMHVRLKGALPVLFTSLPRQALLDRARASLHRCVLCHMTYDAMGRPSSPTGYCHVIARPEFSSA